MLEQLSLKKKVFFTVSFLFGHILGPDHVSVLIWSYSSYVPDICKIRQ